MPNSKKKRIIILSSRGGGPYTQFSLIAEELRKNGLEVLLFSDFWNWAKLHFCYRRDTIILTNVPFLFRLAKKNFYLNIKGDYTADRNLKRNPLGYLYGINKFWSEKIIVPCRYLKEKLEIGKAVIIPNAVSSQFIINDFPSPKKYAPDKKIRLITITKFFFWKKAEGILSILKILSQTKLTQEITYDIFGYGTFAGRIKTEAQNITLPENINANFKGRTKDSAASYQELAESDIFLYWSEQDVMPNIFLEAMSAGLPIVTNNFPSFEEIIGKHNKIAGDEKQYKKCIEELIGNPSLARSIGEKNRQLARNFSIEKVIQQWLEILNK